MNLKVNIILREMMKKIESDFKIKLENCYILNEYKEEVKNERDFEELKSKKKDSNITLNIILKNEKIKQKEIDNEETPKEEIDPNKIKKKVPQLKGDQITELLISLKTYINDLFETKFNEVNNKLNSMEERISLIYNEVVEMKIIIQTLSYLFFLESPVKQVMLMSKI